MTEIIEIEILWQNGIYLLTILTENGEWTANLGDSIFIMINHYSNFTVLLAFMK